MDVSDIFFFCSGEGKGESEAPGGGGGRFFIENPRRGEGSPGGAGGRGAGRVSARNLGGGGPNIFFRGRNSHQERVLSGGWISGALDLQIRGAPFLPQNFPKPQICRSNAPQIQFPIASDFKEFRVFKALL